ncbi:hypothetical protein ACET9Q_12820 [Aeromonas caviae]|jgi:hypothetical protein|uniref:Uncharacterized protein n=1 Tax=Aeromonas caviae TaxID=648 RepID=A0AAV4YFW3_AERCA|nr:hypothetical protein [Aeromonas caviae]GJA39640.1 hypothetical protein KAM343_04360 [Aeromonas caviae]GJA44442.1 hypothetical protein KAM346_07310 [Aeromonas caviae]
MAIVFDPMAQAGINRAAAQMRDRARERFMEELNEAIVAHMRRYGADDEVTWFGMTERPILRYEEPKV